LYTSARPIFMALHRLPKGGDMYLSLVTMLEHAMLTFISRMKQRVGEVCQGKAAFSLLEDQRGNPTPLSQFMERRNAFTLLQRIYNDEDEIEDPTGAVEPTTRVGGILPITPSPADTSPRSHPKSRPFVICRVPSKQYDIMVCELPSFAEWRCSYKRRKECQKYARAPCFKPKMQFVSRPV